MKKTQIILLLAAVAAVVLVYQLPRVVVENDQLSEVNDVKPHDLTVSDADNEVIISLREQLKESRENKKSVNFADSLAAIYLKYQFVDSAAIIAELLVSLDSSFFGKYKAAMIYYRSSQNALKTEKSVSYAQKAKDLFEVLLLEQPENNALKNKLAMTLMTTDTPMQGVMILREVLESDPENREAIFNLGLLAIRSGQYDKAEGRFLRLLEINSEDHEAVFYLGVTYGDAKDSAKAIEAFKKYLEFEGTDAALRATASNFIQDLEKNFSN